MPGIKKNLRTATFGTESGTDVKSTKQLSGESHKTPAEKETNETTQYTTGRIEKGPLGGENTNS